MKKLNLDKQEAEFLAKTIDHWLEQGQITKETAETLQNSYEVKGFDWRRLAQYSFWIALVCGVIAIASLIIDDAVIRWLKKLYNTPDIVISIISGLLAAWLFYRGQHLKKHHPQKIFSNEAVIFLGVLFTASCIAYLGKALDNGSGHFSILFLLSVFVYGFLAIQFNSKLIWAFALISLGSWFGTETGYQTDWSHYFLGMNYPLRFTCFGALLVVSSFLIRKVNRLEPFKTLTYVMGMLYLLLSLWLLSIFGNFGSIEDWLKIKQSHLFYWGILSALIAIACTLYGLKYKDTIAREFGITFLLINLYTRYFEYFWDNTNKTLFFAILAISFWLIGRKAEKIWSLDSLKKL
ncbi:DUF2157 domain-containing protein [Pedobacter sp. BS3]|uniref:DUF2157 domain-containing protein n=1 Tax=Pedobacter sp. BS3 TaxID=2567937 RepID=UPI0011F045C8|nr:DUF2157 domain-containing protein [Pedobacter sp. BS3]TZF82769.1 DUF2157 domain-containing protein [Pedobacter sp. BS3]